MNITVQFPTDQKAALLAGKNLPRHVCISVSQERLGKHWPNFVEMLDMDGPVPRSSITVTDDTEDAVLAYFEQLDEAAAREQAKKRQLQDEARARILEALAYLERDATMHGGLIPERRYFEEEFLKKHGIETLPHTYSQYDGFRTFSTNLDRDFYVLGNEAAAWRERLDSALATLNSRVAAANQAAMLEALPALLEKSAAQKAANELAEQKRKEAAAARAAERLRSGTWTKATDSYNEKRYSPWWVASVDFSSGAKGTYSFGESSGTWGKAGVLSVPCQPGDFIAYGQKDLRRPDRSEHTIMRMQEDGRMQVFASKAEAYAAFNS